MIAFLAALAAFVAVGATAVGVMQVRVRPVEQRLARLAQNSAPVNNNRDLGEEVTGRQRRGLLIRLVPRSMGGSLQRMLVSAGWSMNVSVFLCMWLLSIVIGVMGIPLLFLALGGHVGALALLLTLPAALAGLILPGYFLRRAVVARRSAVWRGLPDACDLITLSVEAGLGLDASLRLVSQKLRGALAEEVGHALREIQLGRPRKDALEAMVDRVKVPALSTFVQSLVQTEQLGTSLGMVLRAQGISIRTQRRQRAQELVRKAPVKMIFPLVFCTLPAFFIITIGPVVVKVATELSK